MAVCVCACFSVPVSPCCQPSCKPFSLEFHTWNDSFCLCVRFGVHDSLCICYSMCKIIPIHLAVVWVCSFANSLIQARCLVGQLAQVSLVVAMVTASPPSSSCQPFVDFLYEVVEWRGVVSLTLCLFILQGLLNVSDSSWRFTKDLWTVIIEMTLPSRLSVSSIHTNSQ